MDTFGQYLKELRQRKGKDWTAERVALAIHVAVRTYWRYESGERVPGDTVIRLLAQVLDGDVGRLVGLARLYRDRQVTTVRSLSVPPLPEDDDSDARTLEALARLVEDEMERRGFIGLSGVGIIVAPETRWLLDSAPRERASTETVDAICAATVHLRTVADSVPLRMGLPPLQSLLTSGTGMLRDGHYEPAAKRGLYLATSTMARAVGWLHYEAGNLPAARSHIRTALMLAHAGGDPTMAAYTLEALGHVEPESAASLLLMGFKGGAGHLSRGQEAWMYARLGRVYADAGNAPAALHALDMAHDGDPSVDGPSFNGDPYMSWCSRTEVDAMAGGALGVLGRHGEAAELLRPGLTDASTLRDRAMFGVRLARVQVNAGEPDAAVDTSSSVLDILRGVDAPRALERLDRVIKRLPDTRTARELRERRASIA